MIKNKLLIKLIDSFTKKFLCIHKLFHHTYRKMYIHPLSTFS